MKEKKTPLQFGVTNLAAAVIIASAAFILYGNTLFNGYCLDDSIVITKNEFTKEGISGIGDIFSTESFTGFFGKEKQLVTGARYRPLSIATFAIEQGIFQKEKGTLREIPGLSHFINVLLFALTGFLLYRLLHTILKKQNVQLGYIPLLTALLFIFHPIHTEVVANIKGRDEILALLFSLAGCLAMVKYSETPKTLTLLAASLLWLLGLFSKENAIAFWVLMPMVLFLYGARGIKKYIAPILAFSLVAALFLIIRHAVIGGQTHIPDELMNDSFLHAEPHEKYATIFYTLIKYIGLLFFPVNLTYDYYPYHIPLVNWGNLMAIGGFLVYTGLMIWWLMSIKKNFLIVFALTFYLLPLLPVSNLFFPIGTFMSERFIYFSSVGFCLLLAIGFEKLLTYKVNWKYGLFSITAIIFILFSIKTIHRNQAWKNDYTLFTTDVKTSHNSAKSNCSAGGIMLESSDTIKNPQKKEAVLNQAMRYLKQAVAIHPKYSDAWLLLGNVYYQKNTGADSAFLCYSTILNYNPDHDLAYKNMKALADREKNIDTKIFILANMLAYQPNSYETNYELGKLYGKEKNDLDKSILYLSKAVSIDPKKKDAYLDLGVAYGFKRDFAASAKMLEKAVEIDPTDATVFQNLGVTYMFLKQPANAAICFKKAEALRKK